MNKEFIVDINQSLSTTRLLSNTKPKIVNKSEKQYQNILFLPDIKKRKGEGGLRTMGYFKHSYSNKPLVTIITVVFNGEKYLDDTIQSVLNQTYDNIEYIIIDGGSTDDTLEIIRKHEHTIDYWISEDDEGIYDAMNKGIKLSQGKIIGILNSDDWYEIDTIAKVAEAFNHEDNIHLVHGAMNKRTSSGRLISTYGSKRKFSDIFLAPFNHPTCFFSTKAYKIIGLYDQNFNTAADYDLMLRFKKSNLKAFYLNEVLTNFRNVGITAQVRTFPVYQIWKLLRKNGYTWYKCLLAICFRTLRLIIKETMDFTGISRFKKKIYKYISYHN